MDDDKAVVEEGEIHDDDNDVNKDEREDIPDNFFDDFNNEGFMESLQIVDSLDDTIEEDGYNKEEMNEEEKTNERKKPRRSEEHRRRSRSRNRRHKGSPPRQRKFDETALRRDPNKTKRDLEKDRENFFKKKEQKVISKIIETGLVPPGMESEVNMSTIEPERNKELEVVNDDKIKTKSRERKSSRERRNEILRERRRRRSRSRSFSDKYSPRLRSRSRGNRRERSRDKRRSFDKHLRSRSRERSRVYDHVLYSPPNNRRRRSRSISDRERWLKQRRSPERKYQGIIREKKMSFLEEIKLKLNGETSSGGDMVTYPFPKNPVQPKFPADVFHDMSSIPVAPQYSQSYMMMGDHSVAQVGSNYNEDFFIGDQSVAPINPIIPQMAVTPMMPLNHHQGMIDQSIRSDPMANTYGSLVQPVPPPLDTSEISAKVSQLMARISASTNPNYNQGGHHPQVERQWNMTDFLHINRAPECSSNGEALKKKVDVLSRCQDFLKELTGDKKSNGKLKVTKTNHLPNKLEQNASPLLRQKPLKFSFNTPLSDNNYQDILNRALIKTGVVTTVIDLVDDDQETGSPISAVAKKKVPFDLTTEPSKSMSMKMCQTDPVKCEDCEKRKEIQYRSIGTQCGESERYNVGVQVVEEDIINSRIPKNQSLAHMTPAQLLGRSDPVSSRAESFGNSGHTAFRNSSNWSRPRDYYDELGMEYAGGAYYGGGRDRDPRFARY
ncbi:stress response protein NST1-like isoform X2 [Harmonia axyridis]|uniref:stress response protein NST1-like isoform X2 n=1 Tax=Harmonia axyridis TaxID=115357 RepID=UPI001E2752D3|nr:stress response protein NST1-like isoform X2 [Harmonia axyridis]